MRSSRRASCKEGKVLQARANTVCRTGTDRRQRSGGFSASLKTFAFRREIWYNIFEAVYRDDKQHGLMPLSALRADSTLTVSQKCPCKQAFLLDGIIGHAIALSVLVHSITVSAKMTQCVKLRRETGFCFLIKLCCIRRPPLCAAPEQLYLHCGA